MTFDHRNNTPSGVKIGASELTAFVAIVGSGVTPANATLFADYIKAIREQFPYQLDAVTSNT